jgi:nucleoside-diphosphate-sugar epimerase
VVNLKMTCEIVVTGASGIVGRALMSRLLQNGFSVTGLSRVRMSGIATYANAPVPDGAVLVHLAQGRDSSGSFGDEDIELCRTLSNRTWRQIVYTSSANVYGDAKDYPRCPEEVVSATVNFTHA